MYIHIYHSYIYPVRQCWSLPPTQTMLMFWLVKQQHYQYWCLTPVKKSMDIEVPNHHHIYIYVHSSFWFPNVRGPWNWFGAHTYWISGRKQINYLFASLLHPLCESLETKHGTLNVLGNLPLPEADVICSLHYRSN